MRKKSQRISDVPKFKPITLKETLIGSVFAGIGQLLIIGFLYAIIILTDLFFRLLAEGLHFCLIKKAELGMGLALGLLLLWASRLIIKPYRVSDEERSENEVVEKVAELQNKNQELRSCLDRAIIKKGRIHPETAYAYRMLGENLKQLGDCQGAEESHRAEMEIYRETLGDNSPAVARALRSIGSLEYKARISSEKEHRGSKNTEKKWRWLIIGILGTTVIVFFGVNRFFMTLLAFGYAGYLFAFGQLFMFSITHNGSSNSKYDKLKEVACWISGLIPSGFYLWFCVKGFLSGKI